MRRLFTTLLAVAAIVGSAKAGEEFFHTGFSSHDEFNQWTVIDANGDENTWQYAEDGDPSKVFYSYHSTNAGDDWLISPLIALPGDEIYMVKFTYKGSYYGENLEVWTGNEPTVESMTTKQITLEGLNGDIKTSYFFIQNIDMLHIGFHVTSPADTWRLYLIDVTVEKAENPVDLTIHNVLSPVSGENLGQENIRVIVLNNGLAVAETFNVGYIIDDGEPVIENAVYGLFPSHTLDYTFRTKADLSIPRHLYTIKVFAHHPDDIDNLNDTITFQVRHKAPATVPYSMGFEPSEYTEEFKYYNLNEDSGDWAINVDMGWFNMARTGFCSLAYNYDKNNNADDWAILEPINVEPGYYVLRFWYAGDDSHPESLRACWGNGNTPDDMTNEIVSYKDFYTNGYEESVSILHFDTAQTIYLGFHACSQKDQNWINVDDLEFYQASSSTVDLTVNEMTAPTAWVRTAADRTVKLDVRNVGIIDAKATLDVKVDDQLIKTVNVNLSAQEIRTLTLENLLADVAEGRHTLSFTINCDNDANADNNTLVTEINVLGTPVLFWDMETGLPEEFTYEVQDTATPDPNSGDEFNEFGWGIFNIGEHAVLGTKVLACNTWFTDDTQADRWLYLPGFTVNSDNAALVWNANSFNPNYLETYEIQVSTDPTWYWLNYSTAATVKNESIYTKSRGVDLGSYAGQEIWVAFRVRTTGGEALILDNIGIYGDVTASTLDITTDTTDAPVEYFDLQGRRVLNPSNGIYLRRQGTTTTKVIF
ncbi:MAG: choice-of-anchor J domain-containing protein [Muribaculaceae bacterium]